MDYDGGERRVFFENAGGALRLKESARRFAEVSEYPDCGGRFHERAHYLKAIQAKGTEDARLIFNAKTGKIGTAISATQSMYKMVEALVEGLPGTNIVTSPLEHPSVFDAIRYYAEKKGLERRIAKGNPETGGVDPEELIKLIDQDTVALVFMAANNITGAIYDVEAIVEGARKVRPDLYIVVDFVQHAPHAAIDVEKLGIDGANFAPYKFFGQRGYSFFYVSDRMAKLTHPRIYRPADADDGNWILGSAAYGHYADVTVIVDYVCWIGSHFTEETGRRALFVTGMEKIELHERALLNRLLYGADGIEGVFDIENADAPFCSGDLSKRDLIVPVTFSNLSLPDAVKEYEKHGVIVWQRMGTNHFSENVMNEFNIPGVIRVSPLHCHSTEDVDIFLRATKAIASL